MPNIEPPYSRLAIIQVTWERETTYQIQEDSYNFEGNDKITKISYKILMAILL